MTSPEFFTVTADFAALVEDASTDPDYDPQVAPVQGTVTFTPVVESGDIILATQMSPRPTGLVPAAITAIVDSDGRLKLRTATDEGGSGFTFAPVRLMADTALLELDSPLYYSVSFSGMTFNGRPARITGFTFQAPNADVEVNLIEVARAPGVPADGVTKIAPTGVRYDLDGDPSMIFTFGGVDIPEPLPLSEITGPQGPGATIAVGTVSTGSPGTSVVFTNTGTSGAAVFDVTIPRGDKGDTGDAATIAVGTVSTGSPGTDAAVVNSGSSGAAVFDFTIPRGDPGATNTAPDTHAASEKTTPVDADEVPLVDSAASWGLKKLTWANLKAAVGSWYDTAARTLTNKTLTSPTVNNPILNTPVFKAAGGEAFCYVDGPNATTGFRLYTEGTGSVVLKSGGDSTTAVFTPVANGVNYIQTVAGTAGAAPYITATGSDASVSLNLTTKGSGTVQANGVPVVTTSGAQSLSNKTISGASNTLSNIPQSAVTNLTNDIGAAYTGDNLCTNPGFELDTYLGNAVYDTAVKRFGTRSARLDSDGSAPNLYLTSDAVGPKQIICSQGEVYWIEAWVYGDPANTQTTGTIELCCITRNSADSQQWNLKAFPASTSYNGVWTRLCGTIQTTQADAQYMAPLIRLNGIPAGDKYWFDDVVSYRIGVPGTSSIPALVQAHGSDVNIDLDLRSKGSGVVEANGVPVVTTTQPQTLSNKTLDGASNTITNLPASATPNAATKKLYVGAPTAAGYWVKLVSFDTSGAYSYFNTHLTIVTGGQANGAIATLTFGCTTQDAVGPYLELTSLAGPPGYMSVDMFKAVRSGVDGPMELWMRGGSTNVNFHVYETARSNYYDNIVTWHGTDWQADEPVGTDYNVQTSAIKLGSRTTLQTPLPLCFSLGGTLGNNAVGAIDNLKLRLYDAGSVAYGLGASSGKIEYQVPLNCSHAFYVDGVERFSVSGSSVRAGGVDVVTTTQSQTLTNKTLSSPKIDSIKDANGNSIVGLTALANAVNYFTISNAPAGSIPAISASSTMRLAAGGTGYLEARNGNGVIFRAKADSASSVNSLLFLASTAGSDVEIRGEGSDADVGLNLRTQGSGTVKVNSVPVVTTTGTQSLTNKRITARVGTVASSATPSIDCDAYDQYNITALAAAITSVTITGTPTDGQKLLIRIKDDGTGRAIAWGASFVSSGVAALPTTTVASKTHLVGLLYDSAAAKWVCVAADGAGY